MSDEKVYDWDEAPITPTENEYVLLPVGNYPFTVKMFERGEFPGSAKLSPCKKASITIEVDGGPLGKVTLKTDLMLHSKLEWKIGNFFTAIGDRKSGDPIVIPMFRQCVGKSGMCSIKHRLGTGEYANTKFNEVDSFLAPPKVSGTPAPARAAVPPGPVWEGQNQPEDDLPF